MEGLSMLAAGRNLWHTFTLAASIHMEVGHVQGFPELGIVGKKSAPKFSVKSGRKDYSPAGERNADMSHHPNPLNTSAIIPDLIPNLP